MTSTTPAPTCDAHDRQHQLAISCASEEKAEGEGARRTFCPVSAQRSGFMTSLALVLPPRSSTRPSSTSLSGAVSSSSMGWAGEGKEAEESAESADVREAPASEEGSERQRQRRTFSLPRREAQSEREGEGQTVSLERDALEELRRERRVEDGRVEEVGAERRHVDDRVEAVLQARNGRCQ